MGVEISHNYGILRNYKAKILEILKIIKWWKISINKTSMLNSLNNKDNNNKIKD